jgi:hypothetical protein
MGFVSHLYFQFGSNAAVHCICAAVSENSAGCAEKIDLIIGNESDCGYDSNILFIYEIFIVPCVSRGVLARLVFRRAATTNDPPSNGEISLHPDRGISASATAV